jgi:hypothetical protein
MESNIPYYCDDLDILPRYIPNESVALVYLETDGRVVPRHPDRVAR